MSLSIYDVVNINVNSDPKGVRNKDFGVVALFTPESGSVFVDTKTRYVYVGSQQEVEALFGTNSETARCSLPFFAQEPRAKQLVIARWQKERKTIDATNNELSGAAINDTLPAFKQIANGCFSFSVGSEIKQISQIDLTDVTSFADVATKITEKLTELSITVKYDSVGNRFKFNYGVAGNHPDKIIGYLFKDKTEGDYLGSMLKMENGQATQVIGVDQVTLGAESIEDALFQMSEVNRDWFGMIFAAQLTDDEFLAVGKYAQVNSKLAGFNVIKAEQLEWSDSNVFKKMSDQSLNHVLPIYDKNDLYPASSAIAVLLSMNFSANNSVITLKFKKMPTISADDISQTEYQKAKRLGINIYTFVDTVAMITDGTVLGGEFADDIVGTEWLKDAMQKAVFNRLYSSPKVPLTDPGVAILISEVEKVCQKGVRNGLIAPGVWTRTGFGKLKKDDYLEKGFYVYADTVANLSDSDRKDRKAPPIQTAVKYAGAIHKIDLLLNINL